MTELDEYWANFLKNTNRDLEDKCSGDLCFEGKGFVQSQINSIVLVGQKQAFFTTLATFTIDDEPLPISGELYILVDNQNKPLCVLEIESVNIIPFNEVTFEMVKKEGECATMGEWKEKMQEYIEDEAHVLGFEYSPDIKLVYQTFKVIYK
jgi:uncharacterized protein YhfF